MDITAYTMQLVNLDDKCDLYHFYILLSEKDTSYEEYSFGQFYKLFTLAASKNILNKRLFIDISKSDPYVSELKLNQYGSEFNIGFSVEFMRKIHRSLSDVGIEKFNKLYHSYYLFTHIDGLIDDVKTYIGIVYVKLSIVHPI